MQMKLFQLWKFSAPKVIAEGIVDFTPGTGFNAEAYRFLNKDKISLKVQLSGKHFEFLATKPQHCFL